MSSNKKIIKLIFKAIDEINSHMSNEHQLKKATKTVLFGRDGNLDSLGLVNLLVAIEQNIEDEFDVSITIADEKAMSQKRSPFRTIETLTDYIENLIKEIANE